MTQDELTFIRINNILINLKLLTSAIYREDNDATFCFFIDGNCKIINGNQLDFFCEVLGDQVKKKPNQPMPIKANNEIILQSLSLPDLFDKIAGIVAKAVKESDISSETD